VKPEARLQAWGDRYIDRVVLPPMFTTALEHGSQEAAGNVRRAAQMMARGAKFGLPDCLVIQGYTHHRDCCRAICFIEYKRGRGKLSTRQEGVREALQRVGVLVHVARSIDDVFEALRGSSFDLHPNAKNIAVEYEERLMASDRKNAA